MDIGTFKRAKKYTDEQIQKAGGWTDKTIQESVDTAISKNTQVAGLASEIEKQSREIEEVKAKVGQAVANTIDTPFTTAYWKDSVTNKIYLVQVKNGALSVTENGSSGGTLDDLLEDRLLIWHDEFEGTELNTAYWSVIDSSATSNNELQYYTPSAVSVKDSVAKITAEYNSEKSRWESARFSNRGLVNFRDCRIEARIKTSEQILGFCPAFWTCGETHNGQGWSKCGEIDIFEVKDAKDKGFSTIHYCNTSGSHVYDEHSRYSVDMSEWHKYSIELEDGTIKYYIDDTLVKTLNTNSYSYFDGVNPFDFGQYVIFNIAVGGNVSNGSPSSTDLICTMEIDYVRVYSHSDATESNVTPTAFVMEYLGNTESMKDGKIVKGTKVQLFPTYRPDSSIRCGIVDDEVENETILTSSCGYISALEVGSTEVKYTDCNGLTYTKTIEVVSSFDSESDTPVDTDTVNFVVVPKSISTSYGNYPTCILNNANRGTLSINESITPSTAYDIKHGVNNYGIYMTSGQTLTIDYETLDSNIYFAVCPISTNDYITKIEDKGWNNSADENTTYIYTASENCYVTLNFKVGDGDIEFTDEYCTKAKEGINIAIS